MSDDWEDPPRWPDEVPHSKLVNDAENHLITLIKNAVDSIAPLIRGVLLRLKMHSYNDGIAQGQKQYAWLTHAYLAALAKRLGVPLPAPTVSEVLAQFVEQHTVGSEREVRDGAARAGLPLDDPDVS